MELEVAIPTPVYQTFTYQSLEPIRPGTRVLVPFGGRKMVGVVLGEPELRQGERTYDLKSVAQVLDDIPVYSDVILQIARWLSEYYLYPIGEVLRTMLPAGSEIIRVKRYSLSKKGKKAKDQSDLALSLLFDKKDFLNDATLKNKIKRLINKGELPRNLSVKGLVDAGLLRLEKSTLVKARALVQEGTAKTLDLNFADQQSLKLTALQQSVFETIVSKALNSLSPQPVLLRGVTGSGKTEVYLQLIAETNRQGVLKDGVPPQALVLVPEISLTPQMTRVFEVRFPGRVAVVHSAMADQERWQQMERIRTGDALILIGPRSAVFGPFTNLKLIIVDEEHDSSYKQGTGLTYNGRDVAILRAKLEGAAVLLGSATPSMETYYNAVSGKYLLCEMPDRVTGRALPKVKVVASKPGFTQGTILTEGKRITPGHESNHQVPIEESILEALVENHAAGLQSIVLVNRRGHAYYLFSLNDKASVRCPNCSISLTLHYASTVLHCHYCDYRTTTDEVLRKNPDDQFLAVGYGSEKVEDYLRFKVPGARVERLDSDVAAKRGMLNQTLNQFRSGEIDILVGTQILAKGHDFPRVTLICLLDIDQTLDLPDFRAGERTFQLAVQAAGRAGRAEIAGQVLVQTSRADHPVIRSALEQDYLDFAGRELELRQLGNYPPFSRMIAFEFSSSDRRELSQVCDRMERWLGEFAKRHPEYPRQVRVLGPAVPAIEMIRNRHRRTLIMSGKNRQFLWGLAKNFLVVFGKLGGDLRVKVDVDPQSMM